jgi:hypothetical protein
LQPVLQDMEFHRPPALRARGGSSAGGETAGPPPPLRAPPPPPAPTRPRPASRPGLPGARRQLGPDQTQQEGGPAKLQKVAG